MIAPNTRITSFLKRAEGAVTAAGTNGGGGGYGMVKWLIDSVSGLKKLK
jgi:hypothetical protein